MDIFILTHYSSLILTTLLFTHSSLPTITSMDAFHTTITSARPIHDGPEEETINMDGGGGYCVVSARPAQDGPDEETVNMDGGGGYCVIA